MIPQFELANKDLKRFFVTHLKGGLQMNKNIILICLILCFLFLRDVHAGPHKYNVRLHFTTLHDSKTSKKNRKRIKVNVKSISLLKRQGKSWEQSNDFTFRNLIEKQSNQGPYYVGQFPAETWKVKYSGGYGSPYKGSTTFSINNKKKNVRKIEVKCKKRKRKKCSIELIDGKHQKPIKNHEIYVSESVGAIETYRKKKWVGADEELRSNSDGVVNFYVWDGRKSVTFLISGDHYKGDRYQKKRFSVDKLEKGLSWIVKRKKPKAFLNVSFKIGQQINDYSPSIIKKYLPNDKGVEYWELYLRDYQNWKKNPNSKRVVDKGQFDPFDSRFYFYNIKGDGKYILLNWIDPLNKKAEKFYKLNFRQKRVFDYKSSETPLNLGSAIFDINKGVVGEEPSNKEDVETHKLTCILNLEGNQKRKQNHASAQVLRNASKKIYIFKGDMNKPIKSIKIKRNRNRKVLELKPGPYKIRVTSELFYPAEKTIQLNKSKMKKFVMRRKPVINLIAKTSEGNPVKRGWAIIYDGKTRKSKVRINFSAGQTKIKSLKAGSYLIQVVKVNKKRRFQESVRKELTLSDEGKSLNIATSKFKEVNLNFRLEKRDLQQRMKNVVLIAYSLWKESMVYEQFPHKKHHFDGQIDIKLPRKDKLHLALRIPTKKILQTETERKEILEETFQRGNVLDFGKIDTTRKKPFFKVRLKGKYNSLDELIKSKK